MYAVVLVLVALPTFLVGVYLAAVRTPASYAMLAAGCASIVGVLTLVLVPLQVLLIAAAARGFSQKWSVEVERRPGGLQGYVAQRS